MSYSINSGACGTTITAPLNSAYVTTSGSNGTSFNDIKPGSIYWPTSSASIHVQGHAKFEDDAEFKGKITVKGVDLVEAILNIESRLNILRPNKELESRWEELRELGKRYRELEADIIAKEHLIALLTKD